jgi:hypothetical protein
MNRRICLLPIAIAIGAIAWFYFSLPTFINPETGRKSKLDFPSLKSKHSGCKAFSRSYHNPK